MRAWNLLLCVALAALTGCKDGGSASVDTPREFYEAAAPILCDYALRCESPKDLLGSGFFCHPSVPEALEGELLFDEPNVVYDPELARQCLAAIEDAIDSCSQPTAEVCARVFRGTQGEGEACDSDQQCQPTLYCAGDTFGAMCAGTCAARAEVAESCAEASCAAGLGCDETDVCVPLGESGDPCFTDRDCLDELLCDGLRGEPGECFPPSDAEGRPCEPSDSFDDCPPPTDCSADGVCVRYELGLLAGPGESCEAGECVSLHVCVDGACEPQPVVGGACDAVRECLLGICVDGSCALLENGAACESDDACRSDRCEDGVCLPPATLGETCTFDSDCVDGAACDEGICVEAIACG